MIDITKNNTEFEKLSNAEKRVIIAQDVLNALEAKKIIPSNDGVYLATVQGKIDYRTISNWNDPTFQALATSNPDGSFQEEIPNLPACTVCAKGALFLCTVAKANKVKNNQVTNSCAFESDGLSKLLGGIFGGDQLELIEGAFECFNEFEEDEVNYDRSPEERMILIMKNIVRNKGEFIPTQDFEVSEDY